LEESVSLFRREHHLRIAAILQALDPEALAKHACWFGGGTAIALSRGEYRESLDVDFVVSDPVGYRALRQALTGGAGLRAITGKVSELEAVREIRADQYGIRTMLRVAGAEIKFEITHEGRISLESPGRQDRICGIRTLSALDMAATQLLANSDRWSDDSVYSRDLIDLAMLTPSPALLKQAIEKASGAYGESVVRDVRKAIARLKERPGRLDECMESLQMDATPKALLWKRIRALGSVAERS
jgi:hypothetical protein